MLSPPPAASLASPAPHSRSSLALPFSPLTARSCPKMACCQGEWNNQIPNTSVACSSESWLSCNLANTHCQKHSLYYQNRWSRPETLPLPSQSYNRHTLLLTGGELGSPTHLQHQKSVLKADKFHHFSGGTVSKGKGREKFCSEGGREERAKEYMHPHVNLWQTVVWFIVILPLVTLT